MLDSTNFSKKDFRFRTPPNLENYQKAYSEFTWQEAARDISFFSAGKLNAAYNAVDRHLVTPIKDKTALIWYSSTGDKKTYTFKDLGNLSNKFANLLKSKGASKGDRVFIFLSRVPYLYASFLAILKIGSVAGLLFSAFQEKALLDRLKDSGAKILITNKEL